MAILSVNRSNIAITTVKIVDYRCIMHNISKSEAINLLKNSVLEDRRFIYKKYCLKFFIFLYSIYEMVARMSIYKSLNINIEKVMKNPEILNFALDHFKTKKMCEYTVKKLPYLLRYVADQYKS